MFSGPAKSTQAELLNNEYLGRGPNIIPSLFDIPVRFRSHPYTLVADIQKAFNKGRISTGFEITF